MQSLGTATGVVRLGERDQDRLADVQDVRIRKTPRVARTFRDLGDPKLAHLPRHPDEAQPAGVIVTVVEGNE